MDPHTVQGRSVRLVDQVLEWLDQHHGIWRPAVYHNNIRKELLATANKGGTYKFRRSRGILDHDVTAFHQDQKLWGLSRKHRPRILFQYQKGQKDKLTYRTGIWCDVQGRVILDLNGTPIRNYTNIPVVLSSQLEGCYMEAMLREHPGIQVQDFVARMPKDQVKRNALSARMRRYRLEACCVSWTRMAGSDNIKAYIDNLLPAKYIKTNFTECFRDLTDLEVKDIETVNHGNYPERARGRKLSDDVRQAQATARPITVALARRAQQGLISSEHTGDGLVLGSRCKFVEADHLNREGSESSEDDDGTDGMEESVIEEDEPEPISADDSEFRVVEIDVDEEIADPAEEADSEGEEYAMEKKVWTRYHLVQASQDMTWEGILCRVPVSKEHIALIIHLLHPTRQEFRQRLGLEAPPTDPTASYFDQYKVLEDASKARGKLLLLHKRSPHVRVRRIISFTDLEWNTDKPVQVAEEVRTLIEFVKLGG